jgi:hypothetical protein
MMPKHLLAAAIAAMALFSASEASAQAVRVTCTPLEIAVFPNRVHVLCQSNTTTGDIVFFALPTTNQTVVSNTSDAATRFLDIALKQWGTGYSLDITYDPNDTSTGPTFGCAAVNCRPILAAFLTAPSTAGPRP